MEDKPFVSIIVPFFNIEKCVGYCIDSLKEQSYKNYEVILVDDGSTDGTAKLLDDYAKSDNRFRVFHKENGGLSNARNFGVGQARGDYVSFVDGDDVVSPYYISSLVQGLRYDQNTDLVIGKSMRVMQGQAKKASFQEPSSFRKAAHGDLCVELMYEELYPSAWAHLAPKEVYEKIRFPEGCYYEEISTITQFIGEAQGCVIVEEPIYGYVVREGSIVHEKRVSEKQILDYEKAIANFLTYMNTQGYEGTKEALFFTCLHLSRIYRFLDSASIKSKGAKKKAIEKYVKAAFFDLLRDQRIGRGNKIRFLILAFFPFFYNRAFSLFDAMRGEASF